MTLEELQVELQQCNTLATCEGFLRSHLHEIRPLFYGLTSPELLDARLQYEDVFYSFANSLSGQEIRAGTPPPASVLALLLFFISFFERARLYGGVLAVADLLPRGSVRSRAEAIFQYKNITDAATDYLSRFEPIVSLVQTAANNGTPDIRTQCQDLLAEYFLEAVQEPRQAGIDIRDRISALFSSAVMRDRYPILASAQLARVLGLPDDSLHNESLATRTRIVEGFHAEASSLVPEVLLVQPSDEHLGTERPDAQEFTTLPGFVDDVLAELHAVHCPQHRIVRVGINADDTRNRAYLGTYFPRSVIESWNIFSELLSMPIVAAAFAQKDAIRILDIGSGTGGSTVGSLLALANAVCEGVPIEVTSVDGNRDALAKQQQVLDALAGSLPCSVLPSLWCHTFPTVLDGFVDDFHRFAEERGAKYDLVLFWKHLSEYYNTNAAEANGIVTHALRIASSLLVPNGLCCALDLTSSDNGVEYFSMTLNREANAYDMGPDATMTTVLPIPCARSSRDCRASQCFTQRVFAVQHRLCRNDISRVAYRVFAPRPFAATIVNTFTEHQAYKVNARRENESCGAGIIQTVGHHCPSGYTGFFNGRGRI